MNIQTWDEQKHHHSREHFDAENDKHSINHTQTHKHEREYQHKSFRLTKRRDALTCDTQFYANVERWLNEFPANQKQTTTPLGRW